MTKSRSQNVPETKAAASGGPPCPPRKTARGLQDDSQPEPHVDIPDPVKVIDLASALRQKPFVVIADLMGQGVFANVHQLVDFSAASKVALKHGFYARRVA